MHTIDGMALESSRSRPTASPDLATLFDQGGDPKWCWCAWFRVRGRDWSNATAAENRKVLQTAAKEQDHAPGLVAYEDDAVVGWVSLGSPRGLRAARLLQGPRPAGRQGRLVDRVLRRRPQVARPGLGRALLDAAIDYARDHGATTLEAYPVDIADGARIPSANAFHGTLGMFERAGFKVVARRKGSPNATPRPIVRKTIRGRRTSST